MSGKHAEWSAAVSRAWKHAAATAIDVTPTPIAVGKPDLDDRSFEIEEVIEEGAKGFAWVEFSAAGGEADEFISWLAGDTETENPPPVDVAVMPGDSESDRGTVRVHTFFDSYDRSAAAAEELARQLNGLTPGLAARADARYD